MNIKLQTTKLRAYIMLLYDSQTDEIQSIKMTLYVYQICAAKLNTNKCQTNKLVKWRTRMKRLYFVAKRAFVSTVIKHTNKHLEGRRSFFSFYFSFRKVNHLLFRNQVARDLWISVFVFLPRWSGYSPGGGWASSLLMAMLHRLGDGCQCGYVF